MSFDVTCSFCAVYPRLNVWQRCKFFNWWTIYIYSSFIHENPLSQAAALALIVIIILSKTTIPSISSVLPDRISTKISRSSFEGSLSCKTLERNNGHCFIERDFSSAVINVSHNIQLRILPPHFPMFASTEFHEMMMAIFLNQRF